MPSDITIVIADVSRMSTIRNGLALPGRALWFAPNKLSSALESIQLNHPKLVAVDALFAESAQGQTFMERVEKLTIRGSAVELITRTNGVWATTPRSGQLAGNATGEDRAVVPAAVTVVVAPQASTNTRRAYRFRVVDPLKAVVEGGHATVVNLSVLGAQVTSEPPLRPTQTVKIALPDSTDVIRMTAHVAWSRLEQGDQRAAYYRAGMEFADASKQTLEEYCRRYCAEEPLPSY